MRVSTRGRYALAASIYLAARYGNEAIPLSEISQSRDISVKYLETIMRTLAIKGIVSGSKGKGGGFILNREPSQITVYDILKVTEKSMVPVECTENTEFCKKTAHCSMISMWKELGLLTKDYLVKITLKDLSDGAKITI